MTSIRYDPNNPEHNGARAMDMRPGDKGYAPPRPSDNPKLPGLAMNPQINIKSAAPGIPPIVEPPNPTGMAGKAPGAIPPIVEPPNPTGMVPPAPGAITEPPSPTGMVPPGPTRSGGNQTTNQVGKSPALDGNGDPIVTPGSLPGGGRTPAQISGIRPQLPGAPGAVAPRPGARPMQPGPAVPPPAPPPAVPPPIVEPPTMIEPPNPTSMVPPAPGQGTKPIDPANDLRSTQIVAEDDARTNSFANKVDQAAGRLPQSRVDRARQISEQSMKDFGDTDIAEGADIGTAGSDRLSKYGGMTDDAASKLAALDRFELAKQKLKEWQDSTSADYDLDLRKATEKAAGQGMSRSGMLRTSYGDIALTRARDRDTMSQRLLNDALEGTIGDSFSRANAIRGLEEGIAGEERAVRGEQRSDRDFKTGVRTGNVNRRLDVRSAANATGERLAGAETDDAYRELGAMSDLEASARGNTRNRADQMRGERDYQNQMEEKGFQRRYLQDRTERSDMVDDQDRALRMLGAGEAGNPAAMLERLASEGMDPAIIQQLAQQIGARGSAPRTAGAPATPAVMPPDLDPSVIQEILGSLSGAQMPPEVR